MVEAALSPTNHVEQHSRSNAIVRDIVIGMADGLTVPFALAAGLSGAVTNSRIIIAAGMAEIAAGSIAMGLGGYLAAQSDVEHYEAERAREEREVDEMPEIEALEVEEILQTYGLEPAESKMVTNAIRKRRHSWIDFMMRFELGLEEPASARALQSGATIGGSYIAGGLIPLAPYFFLSEVHAALRASIGLTLAALTVFGFTKGYFTGARPLRSALQTVVIGGLAAAAAFFLARAVS